MLAGLSRCLLSGQEVGPENLGQILYEDMLTFYGEDPHKLGSQACHRVTARSQVNYPYFPKY